MLFIAIILLIIVFHVTWGVYRNFRKTHSTFYTYDDSWIIGKTSQEIINGH